MKEGVDRDLMTLFGFSVFLIASLLFGTVWSVYKFDVQGAFRISAYIVTVCAVLLHLIAGQVEKLR